MERGVAIVVAYLQHQMAKEHTPAGQVRRWIEGASMRDLLVEAIAALGGNNVRGLRVG